MTLYGVEATGEMAREVGIYSALLEDRSSVSTTDIGCLITVCKSSFRGSSVLFWPPQAVALTCPPTWLHAYRDRQPDRQTDRKTEKESEKERGKRGSMGFRN